MTTRRGLPATMLCLLAFTFPLFAQDWIKVSPEEAQSHLLRKVEPVYPPFAEAAGIEGIVQVNVGIYTDGRIHSLMGSTGPDALFQAAQDAVLKRTYRTFVKDGVPVNASTTIAVSFKLPLGKVRSYPAPTLSNDSFHEDEGQVVQSTAFSPAMKNWLAKDVEADIEDCGEDDDEELRVRMRKDTTITELPTKPGSNPIYVTRREDPCGCGGASANCSMSILEQTPQSVSTVAKMQAWGLRVAAPTGRTLSGYLLCAEKWRRPFRRHRLREPGRPVGPAILRIDRRQRRHPPMPLSRTYFGRANQPLILG